MCTCHLPTRTHVPHLLTFSLIAAASLAASGPSAVAGSSPSPDHGWDWPTDGTVTVTRAFDPPARPWLPGHRGVDLEAPVGSEVRAPADGTVLAAGTVVDRGVVSIDHGNLRSTFEPVEASVVPGQHVTRGEVIATVTEGHSPGPLHWGARTGPKTYVDPLRLLTNDVVLKAWDG